MTTLVQQTSGLLLESRALHWFLGKLLLCWVSSGLCYAHNLHFIGWASAKSLIGEWKQRLESDGSSDYGLCYRQRQVKQEEQKKSAGRVLLPEVYTISAPSVAENNKVSLWSGARLKHIRGDITFEPQCEMIKLKPKMKRTDSSVTIFHTKSSSIS